MVSRARSTVGRACPTNPAAWLLVASHRPRASSSWTSFRPSRARKYATAAPSAPPPTTVISASRGPPTDPHRLIRPASWYAKILTRSAPAVPVGPGSGRSATSVRNHRIYAERTVVRDLRKLAEPVRVRGAVAQPRAAELDGRV